MTAPALSAAAWVRGSTLLTKHNFFLVEVDQEGQRHVLATEDALPAREHRRTVH